MRGEKRRNSAGLIQQLQDNPHRFEFFQAVRLLLSYHRQCSPKVDRDVLGQIIRFRSSVSLAFPPSEIESISFERDGPVDAIGNGNDECSVKPSFMSFDRVTLTPSFIGLTGPLGVLPRHYTQHAFDREIYHRDGATRAFLDIFSSRAIALFYESWLKYRLPFQYEEDRRTRFLPMILHLAGIEGGGIGIERDPEDGGLQADTLAYYAAAFRQRPRSMHRFLQVVTDYFNISARGEQFVGQWLPLSSEDWTVLGGKNCVLGKSSICGVRVWDRQTRVKLIMGPMRKRRFDEFLPGGHAYKSLIQLFRLLIGRGIDCEVGLVLDRQDVDAAKLGAATGTVRLGWTGCLQSSKAKKDVNAAAYLIAA